MKLFRRICLIVLTVGIVLFMGGLFTGGHLYGGWYYGRLHSIRELVAENAWISSFVVTSSRNTPNEFIWSEDDEKLLQNIDIDMEDANLTIQSGDHLSVSSKGVLVDHHEDSLSIKALEHSFKPSVTLTLPTDRSYQSINIEARNATIQLDQLTCQQFDLETLSASIEIRSFTADDASLSMDSGTMLIPLLNAQTVDLSCDTGSAQVSFPKNQKDYTIEANGKLGNISINQQPISPASDQEEEITLGNGPSLIDVEVSTGTLDLSFEN